MVINNLKRMQCADLDVQDGRSKWRYFIGYAPDNKKKKIVLVTKHLTEFENFTQEDVIFQSFEELKELTDELKRRVKQVLYTEAPRMQKNYKWAYE